MKIPTEVRAAVDYDATVVAELSARNRYLPPPLADRALRGNVDELAERLKTLMRREYTPSPHVSVLVRKAGRGSRPLPYIALEDRLVYRALVSSLSEWLPTIPGRGDYDAFVKTPLEVDGCRYVLKADVAAFYQYIDHEQLIDEVVGQTGDDLAITAVVELLQAGTKRRFGLPQMQSPSDILGDVYVDPIRRSLLRRGHNVFRYADDFRVACDSYSEALSALELIEREAFNLGLVLNEAKTGTPQRSTYDASLGEVSRAELQLFAELASEGLTIEDFFASVGDGLYGDDDESLELGVEFGDEVQLPALPGAGHDETDPAEDAEELDAPSPEQLEVAWRVISSWNSGDGDREWSGHVWSALLRKSFLAFEVSRDERAAEFAINLLVNEPHLTPQVCNYLVAVGHDNPELVHSVLDEVCSRDIVSIWQALWVAFLAGSVSGPSRQGDHLDWLRQQVEGPDPSVSAQAALALARRRSLTRELGAAAYDRAPEAHRPTVALALAAAHGRTGSEFVFDDQVEGWLADWTRTQRWGRRPIKRSRPRGKS